MLSVPPPTRIPLGTVQLDGVRLDLYATAEWARYFQALNSQVVTTSESAGGAIMSMMQDQGEGEEVLYPPSIDGVYVPLRTKDEPDGVPGLTQLKLNLRNVANSITSFITNTATAPRTWTMPDKDGTVAVLIDFAAPPPIGNVMPNSGQFTSLAASGAVSGGAGSFESLASGPFGCNGSTPQAPATVAGAATDLPTVIALCNQLRGALAANGIVS